MFLRLSLSALVDRSLFSCLLSLLNKAQLFTRRLHRSSSVFCAFYLHHSEQIPNGHYLLYFENSSDERMGTEEPFEADKKINPIDVTWSTELIGCVATGRDCGENELVKKRSTLIGEELLFQSFPLCLEMYRKIWTSERDDFHAGCEGALENVLVLSTLCDGDVKWFFCEGLSEKPIRILQVQKEKLRILRVRI